MNSKQKKIADLSMRAVGEGINPTIYFSPAIASPSAKFISIKTSLQNQIKD